VGGSRAPLLAGGAGELRGEYAAWLDEIDDELMGGALIVAEAMPRITRAFLAADRAVLDEATALSADVREHCRRVEEQGFILLAREAPVSPATCAGSWRCSVSCTTPSGPDV
jgi:hypothetical protein